MNYIPARTKVMEVTMTIKMMILMLAEPSLNVKWWSWKSLIVIQVITILVLIYTTDGKF